MPNNKKGQNMNIAQTESETAEVKPVTRTIYVNMEFAIIAKNFSSIDEFNNPVLPHKFNGTGRIAVSIPAKDESTYLSYSSDKAGADEIQPPFLINSGENIKFKLQAAPNDSSNATYKWKDITQSCNDLLLVSGKKHSATYNAVTAGSTEETETDDVTININFKLGEKPNITKFSVTWDPRIRIKR
jgi:hypothetical protein